MRAERIKQAFAPRFTAEPVCDCPIKYGKLNGTMTEILDKMRQGHVPMTCPKCGRTRDRVLGDCFTVEG